MMSAISKVTVHEPVSWDVGYFVFDKDYSNDGT